MLFRSYFAMGLDCDKRPIDALASNMGHCLWTGIVDADRAPAVAEALLRPDLFSGWGIRTLSTTTPGYNPISYHNGTVWPHDTALGAWGLARCGFAAEADMLASQLVEASASFDYSLPEVFAGYARDEILLTQPDRRLDIYASSRWPDTLPQSREDSAPPLAKTVTPSSLCPKTWTGRRRRPARNV
mgnify:CR=1 FL=1